ncbi:MobF family relaxase [Cryobacterium sp. Hz9]|uniref:MobF family relaxase n=1 Tax=Cryobacterium sp. Hz9 TaxID=1259167 RepID=UPI001068F643|nr:MobF family relaxase [Cryobacterium sp. Hz9]TFB66345.1 conjugal transfer protein [Cryobacterium sp. Hz9]
MRVMSAGDGYKYLLRSVAAGDGKRLLSTPLTRYYTEEGTPPGRWMGGGLRGLGEGRIVQGDVVTEAQLQLLIGLGRDPVTGEALGRAYPVYRTAGDRAPGELFDDGRGVTERAAASALEQPDERRRRAVAGYDFTFSIPKSASILWGVGSAAMQMRVVQAHHAAVAEVLAYMEREVAATRTGTTAQGGAVAQVDVTGLIATAFDHFDSRAGDPHLHTHVVISNKVQTVLDGKWRSLDGRPMHEAVVALSELHESLFADELTRSLGVQWQRRERGRDRHPAWALIGVPEVLVAEFSTRSRHIDVETDRLIEEYVTSHGRRPRPVTIMKLRAQATLATRPAKQAHSLADLTAAWRERAARVLGHDVLTVASSSPSLLRAEDLPREAVDALGRGVMTAVSEKRATWRHWNLTAEAARQTMPYRFASASDREAVVGLIVDAAERASLRLTPPELAVSPVSFQREDGTSVFRPRHSNVFTSTELLEAESRLLKRAADLTAPRVALGSAAFPRLPGGGRLAEDQLTVLSSVASSGRVIDVLVGPAGAGKTTAMNALRRAWEVKHGTGSVVGLAPSAAAATVLATDLGIATENLAKWWQSHIDQGLSFRAGQLVIIDEASLAGTMPLDRVTALASDAGAKVLLVGDYAQLQSVDAGGAFSLLVHDRADAPELIDVHRFVHEWEKIASLGLRQGNAHVIDLYAAHDRLRDGSTEAMADAAYEAWRADIRSGKSTVLISDSNEAVATLNVRARTELILEGRVDALHEVALHDGTRAGVGDTVITRRNDRRLYASRGWVRNGDRWNVIGVQRNGSVDVQRQGRRWGSTVLLPASYVAQHVELGYAVTSHRAQGITTDTAHVVVAPSMPRENLYVAMTRGREANNAYVAVDRPDVAHVGSRPGDTADVTARSTFCGILQHVGAELSAHQALAAEQDAWGSVAQLAAEYETLAAAAQHDRWVALVRASGLAHGQALEVVQSDAFGPLTAELRRAEAHFVDVATLLPRVVAARGFEDAQDIAAVLRARVAAVVSRDTGAGRTRRSPRVVAGLIPRALGPMDAAMHQALAERAGLIETRAATVLDQAILAGEPWTRALGAAPRGSAAVLWHQNGCAVAAYRDRYGIVGARPLGAVPESTAQKLDAARARTALEAAHRFAASSTPVASPSRLAPGWTR